MLPCQIVWEDFSVPESSWTTKGLDGFDFRMKSPSWGTSTICMSRRSWQQIGYNRNFTPPCKANTGHIEIHGSTSLYRIQKQTWACLCPFRIDE